MKNFILPIVVLMFAGCGKGEEEILIPEAPALFNEEGIQKGEENKFDPQVEQLVKPANIRLIPSTPVTNKLGMIFVPIPGTGVLFSIWETRVQDYAVYAASTAGGIGTSDQKWGWKNPGWVQTRTHPVQHISWSNADNFCKWLTTKEKGVGGLKVGQQYRLPTDAEWSVAVGLGKEIGNTPREKFLAWKKDDYVYPWPGKRWPPPYWAGNYSNQSSAMKPVDNFIYTAPVGSFAANQYGLYDMGGNSNEWVQDFVLRGGMWGNSTPGLLTSSSRNRSGVPPDWYMYCSGFRCVLTIGLGQ